MNIKLEVNLICCKYFILVGVLKYKIKLVIHHTLLHPKYNVIIVIQFVK